MLPSSDAPKISMKGFSLSGASKNGPAKPNGRPPPKSGLGKRPRSSFAHDEEDSEDSDHGRIARRGKHEAVTGFADGGVIKEGDEKRVAAPLVIPKQENRDWKGEARDRKGKGEAGATRGRNLLPEEEQKRRAGGGNDVAVDVVNGNEGEIKWGLTVKAKVKEDSNYDKGIIAQTIKAEEAEEKPKLKTEDELAVEALMGMAPKRNGPDLVIASMNGNGNGPVTEEDAYKRAIASAPDVSTLEDYEAVPVEEFGAALLRGMGWDGKERESGGKEVKRRQNLLGLGAKELKDAEELGAWVQKTDAKRLRPGGSSHSHRGGDRDKKKMGDYARERDERSHRRDRDEGRDRERERDMDRKRDYDRDGSYRRDRDHYRDRRR